MKDSIIYTHPNLFKTLLSIVFVNLSIGVLLMTGEVQNLIGFTKLPKDGIIPPLPFWGFVFIIAGLLICIGIARKKNYKFTRLGLTISAAIGGFWAFGFVINYLTGAIHGISAPILWAFYTLICMTVSKEPDANPLSVVLQKDIHETLQNKSHRDHVLNKDHPQPNIATTESKQNGSD